MSRASQQSKRTTINRYGKSFYSEIGSLGGQKTVETYGTRYMSLIATLANYSISGRRRRRVEQAVEAVLTATNA